MAIIRTTVRRAGISPAASRVLAAGLVAGLLLPSLAPASGVLASSGQLDSHPSTVVEPGASATGGGVRPDDWPTYGATAERSDYNARESTLTPSDASRLQLVWMDRFNDSIIGSLIVVNGTAYVGDRSGYLVAVNASDGWVDTPTSPHPWATPFLGNASYSRCGGAGGPSTKRSGLLATPTLDGTRIYESGGNTSFYALSLSGQVLQRIDVANHTTKASPWYFDYNWASPLIYHGRAYLGVAALCEFNDGDPNPADWKYVQGQLVEANLTTGAVTATWNATNGTSTSDLGGSIWSTAAVDPTTNIVWATTGNMNNSAETPARGEYPQSVVALNASSLKFLGGCQVGAGGFDADYGAGPTLFTDGKGGRYAGAINKDGTFSAYNATATGGGNCGSPGTGALRLAWADSFCAGTTPGTISPAAFDGQFLYIASDGCTNSSGFVSQVYPSNGTIRWSHSMFSPQAEAHAGVAAADGLVVVAANSVSSGTVGPGELQVLNASNGRLLYHHSFFAQTNAEPIIAEGSVFMTVGNATNSDPGFVAAFRVPLTAPAQVGDASCSGAPVTNCTAFGHLASFTYSPNGGMPPYRCIWQFGDGGGSAGCAVAHAFPRVGTYRVNGTLTDDAGTPVRVWINLTVPTISTGGPGLAVPAARSHEVLEFDPTDNATILFGGVLSGGARAGTYLNDTWQFSSGAWTNLTPELYPSPPPLAYAASAYDPATAGVLVFGGAEPNASGTPTLSRSLWEFAHDTWTNLTGSAPNSPPAVAGAAAAFDPLSGGFVLFGGVTGGSLAGGTPGNATWTLANGTWQSASSSGRPAPRTGAGLAYDAGIGGLLLFGGRGSTGTELNDTWSERAGTWTRLALPVAPAGGDSVVLASEGPASADLLWDGAQPNVTWEFTGGTWHPRATSPHPQTYDPGAAGTLLPTGPAVLVLDGPTDWVFANATWSEIPPASAIVAVPAVATAGGTVQLRANVTGGLAPLAYSWTVPGGIPSNGSGAMLATRFSAPGPHLVRLRVTDRLGDGSCAETNVTVTAPMSVSFLTFSARADAGLAAAFSAFSGGGSGPVSYSWDFGDASPRLAGPSVDHTYVAPGPFTVNVTASDGVGDSANASALVVVAPALAVLGLGPVGPADAGRSVPVPLRIAGGSGPFVVEAFFGDGGSGQLTVNATPALPLALAYSYAATGNYRLSVLVVDALGASANSSRLVAVNASLGSPRLVFPGTVGAGRPAGFAVSPVGGSAPFRVSWTFGDNSSGTGSPVAHTYGDAGHYPVRATMTDAAGANASATGVIVVQAGSGIAGVNPVWLAIGILAGSAVVAVVARWALRRGRTLP